jgi:ribosomal protein S18 acetylase RimI-like enzyme
MDELAYRIRSAEPDDLTAIRSTITVSLAHPEGRGRGTSLRTALQRNELLVLERYDAREKDWLIGGFVEFHLRVDDTLTLKDLGTVGEAPHAGVAKHLLNELFNQLRPVSATCVVRRDAQPWNEILASIPGFAVDGPPEYRRPHYYNIWKWSPELARQAQRAARPRGVPPRGGPRPGRRR